MASLWSSQAVTSARQQLSRQLEEKPQHPIQNQEIHHPYHYHQTVHEKCKHHHGEGTGKKDNENPAEKESTLHKQLHNKIEQARMSEEGEQDHPGNKSLRRMVEERGQVEEEMKGWARTIQKCLKGEHKLSEKDLHQHHTGLKKWLLFMEELFRSYESSLKTQTSIHALQEPKSNKSVELVSLISSPRLQPQKEREHGVKLPHIVSRDRTQFLEARVACLQRQLEVSQADNHNNLKRIKDLTHVLAEGEEEQKHCTMVKRIELDIKGLLSQMEQFHHRLLIDLSHSENLKDYPQTIQSNLYKLQEAIKSIDKTLK